MQPNNQKCAVPLLRNVVWRIFRVITPNPVSLAHPTATSYGFCIGRISYGSVRSITTVSEFSRFYLSSVSTLKIPHTVSQQLIRHACRKNCVYVSLLLIVRCPLSRGMRHPPPYRIRTGKHLCMRLFPGFDPPFSSSRPRSRAAPHRRKGSPKSTQPLRRRESVPIAGTPDARPPQWSAYIVRFPHKEPLRSY